MGQIMEIIRAQSPPIHVRFRRPGLNDALPTPPAQGTPDLGPLANFGGANDVLPTPPASGSERSEQSFSGSGEPSLFGSQSGEQSFSGSGSGEPSFFGSQSGEQSFSVSESSEGRVLGSEVLTLPRLRDETSPPDYRSRRRLTTRPKSHSVPLE